MVLKHTLVFDREGYSPGLFKRMNAKHIACQTEFREGAVDLMRNSDQPLS
jgi:hypothetical protein